MESRESLFRDDTFGASRRDSFIRDEFAASGRPGGAAGRDSGLDEFFPESKFERKSGRIQRPAIVLAIAVIALVVGGFSVWTLMSGRSAAVELAAAAAPPQAEPQSALPAQAAASQPPSTTPAATKRQPTAARSTPIVAASRTTQGVPSAPPLVPQLAEVPGQPAAQAPANILTPTLLADIPVETSAPAGSRNPASRSIDAAGLSRVYSSADADVVPPKMLIEEVPAALVVGMRTRTQAVELMVTEEGDVSRVRLLTEQRRILDTMLLSRAKMWKFTPALRNGYPVRYRLVVNWESND